MEEHFGHGTPLQLMSLASSGHGNGVSHLCQDYPSDQYVMEAGRNQIPPVPLPVSHWIQCQQASQGYVEYFAESGIAEIHREVPYNYPGLAFGFESADSSVNIDVRKVEGGAKFHEVKYLRPQNEGGPVSNFSDAEYQLRVQQNTLQSLHSSQKQESNESHSRVAIASRGFLPKPLNLNPISRRRATAADRSRRLRIAERLDALHELLLHPKEVMNMGGSKASLLDDIIDHIKYLQLQVKELGQSRLGGESISDPFIFLEGYGHYLLHDDQMMNEPLEEMMGRLLEVNPSAATHLLASRGLFIMPTNLAEGLHQAV